jgi:HK97 family phage major capsid protein
MAIVAGNEVRSRDYNRAAGGYLFEGSEQRVLATGTATVASTFYDQVQVYQRTLNPTYDLATVIKTRTGGPIVIPRLTADMTTYQPGEGTAITPADPTLSAITLSAYGFKSLTLWSQELDEDEAVNLESLIARTAGRDIGIQAGSAFTVGAGTAGPTGFITACTNGGTAAGTPFFGLDDLTTLFYGLQVPYRQAPGAAWQVSNAALIKMRKFKADTAGTYLWQPSFILGQPDTFMGKPIRENPAMATVASASKSVAFGDFEAYIIREVNGMRVDRSTDYAFNTDQVALKTVWRVDGNLPDVTAIAYMVSHAT